MSYRSVLKKALPNQNGIALVVTLLALVVLVVLSLGVLQNSVAGFRTSGNDRTTKAALAVAEAGAEYSRESLRQQLQSGTISNLSAALQNAAHGGTLVDATQRVSFLGSTGTVNGTLNTPFIASTNFASGAFQVFLTNDRNEPGLNTSASVQSQTDTNNEVMVTSFGNGPGGSIAAVQEQLKLSQALLPKFNLPGVIVMPGPTVNISVPNSQPVEINGQDLSGTGGYPTVAVTTNAAKAVVDAAIAGSHNAFPNFKDAYPFTSPPQPAPQPYIPNVTTENFLLPAENPYDSVSANTIQTPPGHGDVRLTSVKYLTNLAAEISAVADFHSTSDTGFTYGSVTHPRIIAINGDLTIRGTDSGAGILLVTGTLTLAGTPSYNGVMLAIGNGAIVEQGGGGGVFYGGMLIANTNTPWTGNPAYVGVPSWTDHGGGHHIHQYDTNSLTNYANKILPLQVVTYQQLR